MKKVNRLVKEVDLGHKCQGCKKGMHVSLEVDAKLSSCPGNNKVEHAHGSKTTTIPTPRVLGKVMASKYRHPLRMTRSMTKPVSCFTRSRMGARLAV